MEKIIWRSEHKRLISLFHESNYEPLIFDIDCDCDHIMMLTVAGTDLKRLSKTLQYGFAMLEETMAQIVDDDIKRTIFEMGKLYGMLQLSSQICYEKKKDVRAYEYSVTAFRIKHLDEIVSLLRKSPQLTHSQLCVALHMQPSALSECMKKILVTNLVDCRRIGKYKIYSLSDAGLRYSRTRQQEDKKIRDRVAVVFDNISNKDIGIEPTNELNRYVSSYFSRKRIVPDIEDNYSEFNGEFSKDDGYDFDEEGINSYTKEAVL